VGGPVTRHLTSAERNVATRLVATERGARNFARPYVEIDGIRGLSETARAGLDPAALALALNMPAPEASATLDRASVTLARSVTLATAVSTPTMWKQPDTNFDLGAAVASRVVARVRSAVPADPAAEEVRARWVGGLAAGLADSGVAGTGDLREVALTMDAHVMRAADRAGPAVRGPVLTRGSGSVSRPAGPEILRGGAARGGGGIGPRGMGRAIGGGIGGAAARPVLEQPIAGAIAREVALAAGSIPLPPSAAGTMIGSILRPEVPAGGVAAAVSAPARERLDRIRTAQGTALAVWLENAATATVTALRAELTALVARPGALSLARTPPRPTLAVDRGALLTRLDPGRTVPDAMRARLDLGRLTFDAFAEAMIRPIMAAPRFDRPMYQALDAYDREWLVPGLGTLQESEMVTLLSTNDQFTEAFLVGLSDEMGRELLWRQYPTDSRGTYFHRFWDPARDELLRPIHRFGGGRLGSHVSVGPPGQSGRAVVVIRGEIVRRYPDMTVMALREQTDAQGNPLRSAQGNPILPEAPTPETAAVALFHAMLPPDVMLVGLDITVDALRAGGWWIVLAEHPQATRFRRIEPDLADREVRFAQPGGGASTTGATVAAERLGQPVRIAFEADDFLPTS
jgi:hypothetical protein